MIEKVPCVYILASRRHGTIYIGVTSDLCSRIRQHKLAVFEGFTKDHSIKLLVWFEFFGSMQEAIKREKQMKEWQRGWKITLIEKMNPMWLDLFDEQCGRFIP